MGWKDDEVVSAPNRAAAPKSRKTFIDDANALGNITNDWLSFGLSDDGAGVGAMIGEALKLPFNPLKGLPDAKTNPIRERDYKGAFKQGKARYQGEIARAQREMPNASKVAAGVGLVGSLALPMPGPKAARGMFGSGWNAAKTGAGYGALSGVGSSDGNMLERTGSALLGAGAGFVAAPLLYAAGAGVGKLGQGAARLAGASRAPSPAPQLIAERLDADGLTPGLAMRRVNDARARGVPLALIDTGDNMRSLGASVGRKPGPSKTIIRDMVIPRQEAQADRLTGAIERDLGPIVNPRQQSERLMQQARTAADPLYAAFRANPGRESEELTSLLGTPAGRAAMNRARLIAANERRDPNKLGFDLDEQGETVLRGMPSPETLDLVKRGLDDILEEARDGVTGQIKYTPYLRSVEAVRGNLVGEVDRLHPNYQAARQAFAGPAAAEEALRLGQRAMNMPARDIEAAIARMSPAEAEQFRLGYRVALSDRINKSGDYGDKVRLLTGTPEKRRALARAFGGEAGLDRFALTVADEAAAQRTYQAVAGNSETAGRLAEDAETGDMGLVNAVTDAALSTGGSPTGTAVGTIASLLRQARDQRVGKLGEEARGEIAAALSEADPAVLREALRLAQRARAQQRIGVRVNQRVTNATGNVGGRAGARFVAPGDVPSGQYYDPETGGFYDARTGAPVARPPGF